MNAAERQAFDKMKNALEAILPYSWCDQTSSMRPHFDSVCKDIDEAISAAKAVQTTKWSGDPSTQDYASTQPDAGAVMPNGEVVSNVYEAFEAGKRSVNHSEQHLDMVTPQARYSDTSKGQSN